MWLPLEMRSWGAVGESQCNAMQGASWDTVTLDSQVPESAMRTQGRIP